MCSNDAVENDAHIPLGGTAMLQHHQQQQLEKHSRESPLPSPDDSSRGSSPLIGLRGPQFVCEVEEFRITSVVSRKGYLNVLDDRTSTWIKRWVVSFQ